EENPNRRLKTPGKMLFVILGNCSQPINPSNDKKTMTHHPFKREPRKWWRMTGSNRRPPACKAGALPAELIPPGQSLPNRVVGQVGIEPTTPALSRRCSNRLSY